MRGINNLFTSSILCILSETPVATYLLAKSNMHHIQANALNGQCTQFYLFDS